MGEKVEVNSLGNMVSKGTASETEKNNTLGKDDFLQLLVTQLKHQDPLSPMEDKEFIAQMAQFSSLEQMQNLNKVMEVGFSHMIASQDDLLATFNTWQTMANSFNLIGKEVTGYTDNEELVTGVVERVIVNSGEPKVVVNGKEIRISFIDQVANYNGGPTGNEEVEDAGEIEHE